MAIIRPLPGQGLFQDLFARVVHLGLQRTVSWLNDRRWVFQLVCSRPHPQCCDLPIHQLAQEIRFRLKLIGLPHNLWLKAYRPADREASRSRLFVAVLEPGLVSPEFRTVPRGTARSSLEPVAELLVTLTSWVVGPSSRMVFVLDAHMPALVPGEALASLRAITTLVVVDTVTVSSRACLARGISHSWQWSCRHPERDPFCVRLQDQVQSLSCDGLLAIQRTKLFRP